MPPKRYVPPRPRAHRTGSQTNSAEASSQAQVPAVKHQQPFPFGRLSGSEPSTSGIVQQGTSMPHPSFPPTLQKPGAPPSKRLKVGDTNTVDDPSSSTGRTARHLAKPTANTLTSDQHEILLRHRLSALTIHTLVSIPCAASPNVILQKACLATEINSHPLLPGEKALFSTLNAAATTIWPIALSTPTLAGHKAFLIAQNHPTGRSWLYIPRITPRDRTALGEESKHITSLIRRILRCAADLAALRHDGVTVRRALELSRSIAAGAWECDTHELQQVANIGPKKFEMLEAAGILTVRALADTEFYNIDRILKRNPPFGMNTVLLLKAFPRLLMKARFERWAANSDMPAIDALPEKVVRALAPGLRLAIVCVSVERGPRPESRRVFAGRRVAQGTVAPGASGAGDVEPGSRGELLFFHRVSTKCLMEADRDLVFPVAMTPGEAIFAWASCEEVVGTLVEMEVSAPEV
ncbi:hypothetical protein BN1708_014893 [Verticillium longisporum]|uniref:SEC63 domain-containing protein n=3 Tax=Verticillium longisporum TaxID=100787 RepID=A0A0G4M038_VERLO|nr:hypothetical protein HYQ44_008223 [Verticillium longisporum]CRK27656.1 hypothetical protein BN1708_014893 [Verticillium longisporum]